MSYEHSGVIVDGDTSEIDRQYDALKKNTPRSPLPLSRAAFLGYASDYLEGLGVGGSHEYDEYLPSRRQSLASVAIMKIQFAVAHARLVQETRTIEPSKYDRHLLDYVMRRKGELQEEAYRHIPLYAQSHGKR